MVILGLDPGYGRLGFGVIETGGSRVRVRDLGVITTPPHTPMPERLRELHADLERLIQKHEPQVLALERLFFTKSTTTALQVAEVRGVILLLAALHHLRVAEFTPSQLKLALTGNGRADKRAMQEMTARLLNLPRVPRPDDAADALAIALTASTMR